MERVVYSRRQTGEGLSFDALWQQSQCHPLIPSNPQLLGIVCDSALLQQEVSILLQFNCPDPGCDYVAANGLLLTSRGQKRALASAWFDLRQHCNQSHQKQLCDICTRNKKIFVHEHALFTRTQLSQHCKTGDKDDPSFRGHPECEFCNRYFYSSDELFEHCREKHETCHLCQRNGIHHRYYRDYPDLEKHFGDDHFMCTEPICMEEKFVVFFSEIDFKAHMAERHGSKMSRYQQKQTRRIEVDINYGGRPNRQKKERPNQTSNETLDQDSSNQRQFNVPNGFGRLTQSTESIAASSSNTRQNAAPVVNEDWPSMNNSGGSRQPVERLNVKSVFDHVLLDPSCRKQLASVPRCEALEAELAPSLATAMGHDAKKWTTFRHSCHNYLKGVILPEKFYDTVYQCIGNDGTQVYLKQLTEIFPESKRAALLRLFNDKKLRENEFPDLNMTTPSRSSSANNLAGPSRARVLVIKSQSRGQRLNKMRADSKSWSKVPNTNNAGASSAASEFPTLPSTIGKQKKVKANTEQLLFSTRLSVRSDPATPSRRINTSQTPVSPPAIDQLRIASPVPTIPPSTSANSTSTTSTSSRPLPTSTAWAGTSSTSSSTRLTRPSRKTADAFPALPSVPKSKKSGRRSNQSSLESLWEQQNGVRGSDETMVVEDAPIVDRKGKKVLLRFG